MKQKQIKIEKLKEKKKSKIEQSIIKMKLKERAFYTNQSWIEVAAVRFGVREGLERKPLPAHPPHVLLLLHAIRSRAVEFLSVFFVLWVSIHHC